MGMNVNLTIVVQGFNFLLAYILLRTLLLKPAVAVIDQEQANKDAVLAQIEASQLKIKEEEFKKYQHWRACQTALVQQIPKVGEEDLEFKKMVPVFIMPEIDEQKLKQLEQKAQHMLVEKVEHVH